MEEPRPRTPLEKAPEPPYGRSPIPKSRYTSPAFLAREWERMWTRTWLLAARESDLRAPGDWCTFEIGPESILIVRQADDSLCAHYNVCLHRGMRLVEPGRGSAGAFRCRFHGWIYARDGRLQRVTDAEGFPPDLDRSALGLRPVRCETWGGFAWVNLDPEAEPLREYLGVLPAHLDPYRLEEQSLLADVTLEVDCNWKTAVDAFNEAYHIQATHPDLLTYADDVDVQIDCYERHSRFLFKVGAPSPRLPAGQTPSKTLRELILPSHGVDPDALARPEDARPAMIRAMRGRMGALQGIDFDDLDDRQLVDDLHYTIFPNVTLNIHARGFWLFRHRPHESDPSRMLFDFWNLIRVRGAEVPRPEPRRARAGELRLADVTPGGDVLDEDMANLPRIQAGMRSRAYEALVLGWPERRIRHFHDALTRYVEE